MQGSKFICFLLSIAFISGSSIKSNGQTVVNSTGNTIRNDLYYFEYSVGEIAITTINNKSNNATQGLLQPIVKVVPAYAFLKRDLIFEKVKLRLFKANVQFSSINYNKFKYADYWLFQKHPSFNIKTL